MQKTNFKSLNWEYIGNGVLQAEPDNLLWKYYITPLEDNRELFILEIINRLNPLTLIDECSLKVYARLEDAKEKASDHYFTVIQSFYNSNMQ